MPRSIWKGSIAFGLVNIPVSLTVAESSPEIQLHMVDSANHARIRYERVNAETGKEVPSERLVKGYEHREGEFILLSDDEMEAVRPELTKTIEIVEFVSLSEIDPILFERPYYLEPEKRAFKAYSLLREALRETGMAGISRIVIRTREYLSAMFVRDEVLMVMLLRFPKEIRPTSVLELPASDAKKWTPVKRELDLAVRLIEEMSEKWQPDSFQDNYNEALTEHIEKKIERGDTVLDVVKTSGAEKDKVEAGNILDLASYLERSLKESAGKKVKPTPKPASSKPRVSVQRKTPKKDSQTKQARRSV